MGEHRKGRQILKLKYKERENRKRLNYRETQRRTNRKP
jgi:hypothetical protein